MAKRNEAVWRIFREYITECSSANADELEAVLLSLCDEGSISPRIYSVDLDNSEKRTVLDVDELKIHNVKGVADRSISIRPGATLVYGPNDTGKSALLAGLAWAVGGEGGLGAEQPSIIRAGASDASALVSGPNWQVVRSVSKTPITRGKRAGEVDYEYSLSVKIDGSEETKTRGATALLSDWLKVPFSFLKRCALVAQGELTELLDEQPAKRREMVFQLLGLDAAENTRVELSKQVRKVEQRYLTQKATSDDLNERLTKAICERSKIPVEALREEYVLLESAATGSDSNLRGLSAQLEAYKTKIVGAEQVLKTKDRISGELNELSRMDCLRRQVPDVTAELRGAHEQLIKANQTLAGTLRRLEECKQTGLRIKSMPPVCPHCLELGWKCGSNEEVKQKRLAELRDEYVKIDGDAQAARAGVNAISATLKQYEEKNATRQKLMADIQSVKLAMSAKEDALKSLPQVDAQSLEAWKREVSGLLDQLDRLRSQAPAETAQRRADLHAQIASADKLDAQIRWLEAEIKGLGEVVTREHLTECQAVVECFGRTGIPLWLARKHVALINERAAQLAEGDTYIYSFNSDLAVEIRNSQTKMPINPALASGSSRQRGAIVLRAALGKYLQDLSGITIPLYWIDEIPFQDDTNALQVVETVKRLRQWYPKVVLAASQWEKYIGQFDHEIGLLPNTIIETSQQLIDKLDEMKKKDEEKIVKELGSPDERSKAAFDALAAKIQPKDETPPMDPDADECPF